MVESPCYGCEKRNDACHANCEAYLLWVSGIKDQKKKDLGLKLAREVLCAGARRAKDKLRKR